MKQISLEEFNQNKGKFDIIETINIEFFDKDNTVPRIIDFCTKKNDKLFYNCDLEDLIVNKEKLKTYLQNLVKFYNNIQKKYKDKYNENVVYFCKFMIYSESVETYPDWKSQDKIEPRLYIMQIIDRENGLFYTRWHEFRWDYKGNHCNHGSIEPFTVDLSEEEVKSKISKDNTNYYIKISSENVDILADDIWKDLERAKTNLKEELEITPYEKKNLKDIF